MGIIGFLVTLAVLGGIGYFVYIAIQRTMADESKSRKNRRRR